MVRRSRAARAVDRGAEFFFDRSPITQATAGLAVLGGSPLAAVLTGVQQGSVVLYLISVVMVLGAILSAVGIVRGVRKGSLAAVRGGVPEKASGNGVTLLSTLTVGLVTGLVVVVLLSI